MQRCEHLAVGEAGTPYPLPGGILAELCAVCLTELQERLEEQLRPATPIEQYAREKEAEMSMCAETRRKPVKENGKTVMKDVPICGLLCAVGSPWCPRHKFMHEFEDHKKAEKDRLANAAQVSGTAQAHKMPATRAQLVKDGWKFADAGVCRDCGAPIEWWLTRAGRRSPMEPMAHETSFSKSHFAKCKGAEFRRSA